jgi:hypothetical protein
MTHAHELVLAGAEREVTQLDEKLFFDLFAPVPAERPRAQRAERPRGPSCRWFARASCPPAPPSAAG